uniref:Uncharacterized protein n=1 Tax=Arundo donax TaxID=35708 RepID=A0A0A9HJB6_ARUDO
MHYDVYKHVRSVSRFLRPLFNSAPGKSQWKSTGVFDSAGCGCSQHTTVCPCYLLLCY